MNSDWLNDLFGAHPTRPQHPDVARVAEVLLGMDAMSDLPAQEQGEALRRVLTEIGVSEDVLQHVGTQRAMRVLGIQTVGQMAGRLLEVAQLSATWLDGFVAGAKFRDKAHREGRAA